MLSKQREGRSQPRGDPFDPGVFPAVRRPLGARQYYLGVGQWPGPGAGSGSSPGLLQVGPWIRTSWVTRWGVRINIDVLNAEQTGLFDPARPGQGPFSIPCVKPVAPSRGVVGSLTDEGPAAGVNGPAGAIRERIRFHGPWRWPRRGAAAKADGRIGHDAAFFLCPRSRGLGRAGQGLACLKTQGRHRRATASSAAWAKLKVCGGRAAGGQPQAAPFDQVSGRRRAAGCRPSRARVGTTEVGPPFSPMLSPQPDPGSPVSAGPWLRLTRTESSGPDPAPRPGLKRWGVARHQQEQQVGNVHGPRRASQDQGPPRPPGCWLPARRCGPGQLAAPVPVPCLPQMPGGDLHVET